VINAHAYNLTDFIEEHPGGEAIILKYAGRDASKVFNQLHPRDIVNTLDEGTYLGPVFPVEARPEDDVKDDESDDEEVDSEEIPDISQMVNVWDFETIAKRKVTKEAWAYLMSGADDEVSFRENHLAFHRVMLKPRVLVDVDHIDYSSTVLGTKCSIPIYITSCALGRLYHEDGECCLQEVLHWRAFLNSALHLQVARWMRCMLRARRVKHSGGSFMSIKTVN
jgi:L-lactate dehydrogenase (cytochrome)